MSEIVELKAQVLNLGILQQEKDYEAEESVRPILDDLHVQIMLLQQRMAQHWCAYEARVMQSRQDTQMTIVDIERKISALEQENNYALSLFAPIHHLPVELLSEILMLAVTEYGCSALQLTHICRSWRLVLLTLSRIWSKLDVRTWTSTEKIECLLERTRRVTLDVEIDSGPDAMECICRAYAALVILAGTSVRWRNLTIHSLPKEEELQELEASGTPLIFNGPLESLESFKITRPCEMNTALGNLIDLIRNVENSKLTVLELSSSCTLYRFAGASSTIFRFLRVFKVDFAEMNDTLDILPHFQCLEDMYTHRLHLPLYSHTTHLPLLRTLKHLFLKSTSVQWMSNRTFSKLVECTIIWPHFPETLLGQSGVDLPVCTTFIYDDHLLQPLEAFNLPSVDKLVIRNEAWNRPRGSQQLSFIWGPSVLIERVLRPRILHLDTQCYDQPLITALKIIPQIEELILGLVRPDALGKKFLLAMLAKKGRGKPQRINHDGDEGISGSCSGPLWTASLCPSLRVFGLKYRRWLREYENDDLTPLFLKIIETRSKSETPLQSFKFWPTKDTPEQEARELVVSAAVDGFTDP
jgi:hypothetical protein